MNYTLENYMKDRKELHEEIIKACGKHKPLPCWISFIQKDEYVQITIKIPNYNSEDYKHWNE